MTKWWVFLTTEVLFNGPYFQDTRSAETAVSLSGYKIESNNHPLPKMTELKEPISQKCSCGQLLTNCKVAY